MVFGLCKDDDIVKTLHGVFHADIIRVPEARVVPLSTLATDGIHNSFRGDLQPMLAGDDPIGVAPTSGLMADVSGKRTNEVSADVGIKILGGFLDGFQLPSADIQAKFQGASSISFRFEDVYRSAVDINLLGRRLDGRIVLHNAATEIFFEDSYALLILDSTITSNRFSIRATAKKGESFKLDIPGIQALVGETSVGVDVRQTSETEISFKGKEQLAFAFSSMYAALESNGTIHALYPHRSDYLAEFAIQAPTGVAIVDSPLHIQISSDPEMIDLSFFEGGNIGPDDQGGGFDGSNFGGDS